MDLFGFYLIFVVILLTDATEMPTTTRMRSNVTTPTTKRQTQTTKQLSPTVATTKIKPQTTKPPQPTTSKPVNPKCGDGWVAFDNEKCFKIYDDTLRTFDQALTECANLKDDANSGKPSLPIIVKPEEQEFLKNYVFKQNGRVDNMWLGARFDSSSRRFEWTDNTEVTYHNWDPKGPRAKEDYCVQMEADESVQGMWLDEPCNKKNLVVCQKILVWSLEHLQQKLLNLEELIKQKTSGGIPVGFVYTQLPWQEEPEKIWPGTNWTDISSNYTGLFFRVEGGEASSFAEIQEHNSPGIIEVQHTVDSRYEDYANDIQLESTNGWSELMYIGDNGNLNGRNLIKFNVKGGEVRPKNVAIRIWKRTQ